MPEKKRKLCPILTKAKAIRLSGVEIPEGYSGNIVEDFLSGVNCRGTGCMAFCPIGNDCIMIRNGKGG